jgi:hypothetical protein
VISAIFGRETFPLFSSRVTTTKGPRKKTNANKGISKKGIKNQITRSMG